MGYPSPLKNRSKSFSLSVWRSQSLPAFRNQLGTAAVRMSGQISPRCENMRGIKTCIPTICNGCKMDIHIHWCTVTLTKTHMWWKNPGKEKTSLQKHPSRNHLNDFFFFECKKKGQKGPHRVKYHRGSGLLCHHVQNVSEALWATLTPSFVHTEGHVLSTFLVDAPKQPWSLTWNPINGPWNFGDPY